MESIPSNDGSVYHSVTITGGSAVLGNQYITVSQDQSSLFHARCSRFLASLKHHDMNSRKNAIHDAEHNTFEWILRENTRQDIPNLIEWLSTPQGKYFVKGKAGSGKSTFLKFIFEHQKTKELLRRWAEDPILTFHGFWRAGSNFQKTYKGLLASLIFQVIHQRRYLLNLLTCDPDLKTAYDDWSTKELLQLFLILVHHSRQAYCVVIDGLDEYDNQVENEDIDTVLNLIDKLSLLNNVKVCMSSRPIQHILDWATNCPILNLHDFTRQDILQYVTKTLLSKSHSYTVGSPLNTTTLAREICDKADGVFIWVFYVMKNIVQGLRVQDDIESLRRRIARLPSEVSSLYQQMWEQQNRDHDVHVAESIKIFGLIDRDGMLLFQLGVLLNDSMRKEYVTNVSTLDEVKLESFCYEVEKLVAARCAGLLECVQNPSIRTSFYMPRKLGGKKDTAELQLDGWRTKEFRYIHKSAYDFVAEHPLFSETSCTLRNTSALSLTEAYLACCVEEARHLEDLSDVEECLTHLHQLEESQAVLASTCIDLVDKVVQKIVRQRTEVGDTDHWLPIVGDAATRLPLDMLGWIVARFRNCMWLLDYLRAQVSVRQMGAYYLGYLVFCTCTTPYPYIRGGVDDNSLRVSLYLISCGADLTTPQCEESYPRWLIVSPIACLLSSVASALLSNHRNISPEMLSHLFSVINRSISPPTISLVYGDDVLWSLDARRYFIGSTELPVYWITIPSDDFFNLIEKTLKDKICVYSWSREGERRLTWTGFRTEIGNLPRQVKLLIGQHGFLHLPHSTKTERGSIAATILDDLQEKFDHLFREGYDMYHRRTNLAPEAAWHLKSSMDKFVKSAKLRPLSELENIDLTVPGNVPKSSLAQDADINIDNWREKGRLREYFAKLRTNDEASEDSAGKSSGPPPNKTSSHSSDDEEGGRVVPLIRHPVPRSETRKRKRSDAAQSPSEARLRSSFVNDETNPM